MVDSDEDAETITIREKSSGKVVTLNYEDIKEGRISFESDEGRVEIRGNPDDGEGTMTIQTGEGETRIGGGGEVPDWIPAHSATTSRRSVLRSRGPTGDTGQALFTVDAGVAEVAAFYEEELEKAGYEVSVTTHSSGEGSLSVVTGQREGGTIIASVSQDGAETQVAVQYNQAP
jgi:hypothetical protein